MLFYSHLGLFKTSKTYFYFLITKIEVTPASDLTVKGVASADTVALAKLKTFPPPFNRSAT